MEHPDHRFAALFADEAIARSGSAATVEHHRGYNTKYEPPNLTAEATSRKRAAFDAYAMWDWWVRDDRNFLVVPATEAGLTPATSDEACYRLWTERYYLR